MYVRITQPDEALIIPIRVQLSRDPVCLGNRRPSTSNAEDKRDKRQLRSHQVCARRVLPADVICYLTSSVPSNHQHRRYSNQPLNLRRQQSELPFDSSPLKTHPPTHHRLVKARYPWKPELRDRDPLDTKQRAHACSCPLFSRRPIPDHCTPPVQGDDLSLTKPFLRVTTTGNRTAPLAISVDNHHPRDQPYPCNNSLAEDEGNSPCTQGTSKNAFAH